MTIPQLVQILPLGFQIRLGRQRADDDTIILTASLWSGTDDASEELERVLFGISATDPDDLERLLVNATIERITIR